MSPSPSRSKNNSRAPSVSGQSVSKKFLVPEKGRENNPTKDTTVSNARNSVTNNSVTAGSKLGGKAPPTL